MSISSNPFMLPYIGSAYGPATGGSTGATPSYLDPSSPLGQFNQQNSASFANLGGLYGMGGMDSFSGMGGLTGMGGMSGLSGMSGMSGLSGMGGMSGMGSSGGILGMLMQMMQMICTMLSMIMGGGMGGMMGGGAGGGSPFDPTGGAGGGAGGGGSPYDSSGGGGSPYDSYGGDGSSSGGSGGCNNAKSRPYPGSSPTPSGSNPDDANYYPASTPSTGGGSHQGGGGTGNPFSGGKEGLGVNGTSSNGDGSNLASTKASWYYNWSPNASSNVNDPNATFIPMIWGSKNMNSKDLQAAANSNSPMILTFNEPDLPSQGNMSPQEALSYWPQLEATGKKLSSPAISNGPDGIKWLDQFMAGAKAGGHRVDSIALHWYGSSAQSADQNVASLKDYINQVHQKYPDLPIDLTEFGVDASGLSAGKDQAFLTGAEKMLNDLPYVQMYSPYGLGNINGN